MHAWPNIQLALQNVNTSKKIVSRPWKPRIEQRHIHCLTVQTQLDYVPPSITFPQIESEGFLQTSLQFAKPIGYIGSCWIHLDPIQNSMASSSDPLQAAKAPVEVGQFRALGV